MTSLVARLGVSRENRRQIAVIAASAVVIAVILILFGGRDPSPEQRLDHRSIVEADQIPSSFVSASQVASEPPRSPRRAFLQYWRDMQQRSWPSALSRFDPGLRELIGDSRLIRALGNEGLTFGTSLPRITAVERAGPRADVQFLVPDITGSEAVYAHTVSLLREGGEWVVIYDTILDSSLQLTEEEFVLRRAKPGTDPTAAAERASAKVGSLQSRYLEQLGLEAP